MFFADALADLGLRPQRHAIHQDLSQTPDVVGQARCHRRCPWLPPLDRAGLGNRINLGQRQAQAGVRQYEIMISVEEGQLLTQSGFVFAQGVDPPPDGGHMLAKLQVEPLDQGGVDLPTPAWPVSTRGSLPCRR
jgi:hypothetical protein